MSTMESDAVNALRTAHRALVLVSIAVIAFSFRSTRTDRIEKADRELAILSTLPMETYPNFDSKTSLPKWRDTRMSYGGNLIYPFRLPHISSFLQQPHLHLWFKRPKKIVEIWRFLYGEVGSSYTVVPRLNPEDLVNGQGTQRSGHPLQIVDVGFICNEDKPSALDGFFRNGGVVLLEEDVAKDPFIRVREACTLSLSLKLSASGIESRLIPLNEGNCCGGFGGGGRRGPLDGWLQSLGPPYNELVEKQQHDVVMLPHLSPFFPQVMDLNVEDALRYMQGRLDSSEIEANFLGIVINRQAFKLLAPAAIFMAISLLSVHLKQARQEIAICPRAFMNRNWLGFLPGTEPSVLLLISVFFLPISAIISLIYSAEKPLLWPVILVNIGGVVLVILLAGRCTINAFKVRNEVLTLRTTQINLH